MQKKERKRMKPLSPLHAVFLSETYYLEERLSNEQFLTNEVI